MIHYVGDETKVTRGPHLNSQSNRPFIPTSSKVGDKIKKVGLSKKPKQMFEDDQSKKLPGLAGQTQAMRNRNQIVYEQNKLREDVRLSKDKMENIIAVMKHLPGYCRDVRLRSQTNDIDDFLSITAIVEENVDEMRKILRIIPQEEPVVFDMDTTFNMGPYYVTIITVRHPLLKRRIMGAHQLDPHGNLPIGIHFHERKHGQDHQNFCTEVVRVVDNGLPPDAPYRLSRKDITLSSDREFDAAYLFRNTAEKIPSTISLTRQLRNAPCWNHLGDNVKAKLRKLKFSEKDCNKAVRDLKWLLQSTSLDEYNSRKEIMFAIDGTQSPWHSAAAIAYFDKNLDSVCTNEACVFRLAEAGIKNPQFGTTNNVSESFNALLKHQNELKELPVAENLLNFYFTMKMSVLQLQAGYYQTGEFEVVEEYKSDLEQDPRDAPVVNVKTVQEMKQFFVL